MPVARCILCSRFSRYDISTAALSNNLPLCNFICVRRMTSRHSPQSDSQFCARNSPEFPRFSGIPVSTVRICLGGATSLGKHASISAAAKRQRVFQVPIRCPLRDAFSVPGFVGTTFVGDAEMMHTRSTKAPMISAPALRPPSLHADSPNAACGCLVDPIPPKPLQFRGAFVEVRT